MLNPFVSQDLHIRTFAVLALCATVVSTGASLTLLFLIRYMKVWSGHILLLCTMTWFQTLYDVSFFTGVVYIGNVYLAVFSNVAQLVGGMASSFFSNVIAVIAFYVISYRRSLPIFQYYPAVLTFILSTALIDALLFLLSVTIKDLEYLAGVSVLGLYYYAKIFSIVMNFSFALLTTLQIKKISSRKDVISHSEKLLHKLSLRLFYYPIIQAISRSGCAWYEVQYGYEFSPSTGYNFSPDHTDNWKFAAQCTMALSMPIASIGYFSIFLVMQPKAYHTLISFFTQTEHGLSSETDVSSKLLYSEQYEDNDFDEFAEVEWEDEEMEWRQSMMSLPSSTADLYSG